MSFVIDSPYPQIIILVIKLFTIFLQQRNILYTSSNSTIFLLGNGHQYASLKQIATQVKQSTEPLTQKAEDRFDDVSALIKEVTILLSEWDIGTEEGVRLLHRTRDEQASRPYCSCLLGFLRVSS